MPVRTLPRLGWLGSTPSAQAVGMEHKAKDPSTDYAKDAVRLVAKSARSVEVDWKNLSQEERKQFKRRIRDEDKAGRDPKQQRAPEVQMKACGDPNRT